jgi:hypothetical protein
MKEGEEVRRRFWKEKLRDKVSIIFEYDEKERGCSSDFCADL